VVTVLDRYGHVFDHRAADVTNALDAMARSAHTSAPADVVKLESRASRSA
jgi:hypothetical protein